MVLKPIDRGIYKPSNKLILMKTLIYATFFAMLIIMSFLTWWSIVMFSFINTNLISENTSLIDKIQIAQIYSAKK